MNFGFTIIYYYEKMVIFLISAALAGAALIGGAALLGGTFTSM